MGKLNRSTLNPKVEQELKKKLWKTLSSFKTPHKAQDFWEKFLTPSEIAILAKRLVIFKMVIKKKPYQTIQDTLKVGGNTIARAQNTLRKYGHSFEEHILRS
ncbi:MAG: hypothetical protein FJ044_01810 [Candidatus Cloacimonetes bacterium]|nr:hypothetical protein [Candidatus Cloacimonadota bacterium]